MGEKSQINVLVLILSDRIQLYLPAEINYKKIFMEKSIHNFWHFTRRH